MAKWWQRWLKRPLRVLPSRVAYALWATNYPAHAHNPFMVIEEHAMNALLPDFTRKRVLDWACGSGRYSQIAQLGGARLVVGVDNSLPMLRQNQHVVLCASGQQLPFSDESFDVVVAGLAVGHLPDLTATLTELSRVTVQGGVIVMSDLHPFQHVAGAQRTFWGADGKAYAVEHYPYFYADYVRCAKQAGLFIEAVSEPSHEGKPVVLAIRMRRGA